MKNKREIIQDLFSTPIIRGYNPNQKTYKTDRVESLPSKVDGKKVKHWFKVYDGEYSPIFFGGRNDKAI